MDRYISVIAIALLFGSCGNTGNIENIEENQVERELYRPQYHFTPAEKWMNDPNGMVYFEGEYHLFYQYYPDSTVWGPMHWGHAISTDLVSWQHLPVALYPDEHGLIFSGSAVIDWNNTSGLGEGDTPPMVAIFTYHSMEGEQAGTNTFQTQGIAFSNDRGRTWEKYQGNPVILNPGIRDFRDPKVSWNDAIQKWIMVLAVRDHVSFYSSPNLIEWTHESDFGADIGNHGGVWECPDLFKMKVKDSDEEKWVLLQSINPGAPNGGSGTQYFIGDFDGSKFTLDSGYEPEVADGIWLDYGTDNYAGVTWSDIPKEDGRRLFIGWMSNWQYATIVPTEKWRSAMTISRELQLIKENNNYLLLNIPASEYQSVYKTVKSITNENISGEKSYDLIESGKAYQFKTQLANIEEVITFTLSNTLGDKYSFSLDPHNNQVVTDRTQSGATGFHPEFAKAHIAPYEFLDKLELEVFVDESSVEIFIDNGRMVLTDLVFPDQLYTNLSVSSGAAVDMSSLIVNEISAEIK